MLHAFLGQSVLHALLAMMVTEGLLRGWRVEEARWRLRLHLLPLAAPLVLLPLLFVVAPWRLQPPFAESRAIFAGERWNLLVFGGRPLGDLALLLACGAGSALFLRDALPPLRDLVLPSGRRAVRGPLLAVPADLRAAVTRHADRLGIAPPAIRALATRRPVLLCQGWPPAVVVSMGALERLPPETLDAALAHELAHIAGRDPAIGYALIALRAIQFYNPAVQWAARAIVEDLESRADQGSVALTGRVSAMADAIRALFGAGSPPPADGGPSFEWVFWRARRAGMEGRCARLGRAPYPPATVWGPARLALACAAIAALAWYVV